MDTPSSSFWKQLIDALFRDLPRELDRLFREFEFKSNRLYVQPYELQTLDKTPRRQRRLHPSLVLGLAALALLFFGPTFDSICTAIGRIASVALLGATFIGGFALFVKSVPRLIEWWRWAPDVAKIPKESRARRTCYRTGLALGTLLPVAFLVIAAFAIAQNFSLNSDGLCVDSGTYRLASIVQLFSFLVLAALLVLSRHYSQPLHQASIKHVAVFFVAAGAIQFFIAWFLVGPGNREALHAPYLHVFTVAVVGLILIAVAARQLAEFLFKSPRRHANAGILRDLLHRTELFSSRNDDVGGGTHLVHAIFRSISGNFGFTLLPAAMPALLAAPELVDRAFLTGLALAMLFNTWARLNRRWNTMFNMIRRWFFVGWPVVISYLVIAIGVTRFAGIDYVTTIVDGAPLGYFPVLILLGYCTLWFFEYWINRPLGKQYLAILGAKRGADSMRYECAKETNLTAVTATPRWLQLHGTGRLAAVGYYPRGRKRNLAWHTYSHSEFIDRMRSRIADVSAEDIDKARASNAILDDMDRRTALYFSFINLFIAVLVIAFILLGIRANSNLERMPLTSAIQLQADDTRGYSLARHIQSRCDETAAECEDVILLATSGGGSRAALHAVSVLRSLASEQRIDDVALVSGVSGGGASLAYFAAHHEKLVQEYPSVQWKCFSDAMSSSFIQQVIESSGELAMVRRKTLAHTLAESLQDAFSSTRCGAPQTENVIDVDSLGILLNTTVAGHPPRRGHISNILYRDANSPSTEYAGARLAFTNLLDVADFPVFGEASDPDTDAYFGAPGMPYVVVAADKVSLAQAAALNANFPPVFANSEVRILSSENAVDDAERFFVTDGGVAENRGILSLILALQSAITAIEENSDAKQQRYPDITIVIADAGSLSYQYSADRGIGTAVSGGPQFLLANAWYRSMLDETRARYEQLTNASVSVEIKPMPLALRLNGAIGTHWMLPTNIFLRDPRTTLDNSGTIYKVNRRQARCLILRSFSTQGRGCLDDLDSDYAEEILQLLTAVEVPVND